MKHLFFISIVIVTLLFASKAMATCECVCINGEMRAVCSSTLDIEPICPLTLCPRTPPSISPIQMPRIPPIGTSKCKQMQVYNELINDYEWREICY